MSKKNDVITLDAPMDSMALSEMNSGGWTLVQVITEKYEWYREIVPYNIVKKILYKHRYHHYFVR